MRSVYGRSRYHGSTGRSRRARSCLWFDYEYGGARWTFETRHRIRAGGSEARRDVREMRTAGAMDDGRRDDQRGGGLRGEWHLCPVADLGADAVRSGRLLVAVPVCSYHARKAHSVHTRQLDDGTSARQGLDTRAKVCTLLASLRERISLAKHGSAMAKRVEAT